MTTGTTLDPLATALAAGLARELGIYGADIGAAPIERRHWHLDMVSEAVASAGRWQVPVRIYRPCSGESLPILVYLHGGGWFSGGLDMVDLNCRELSARSRCIVVSVQYSLSPANKFPRALEDVDEVCRWIGANAASFGGDANAMAIGGESVGANLAAAECLLAKSRGARSPFALQLLVYPVLDPDMSRPEVVDACDPILSSRLLEAMWRHYTATQEEWNNPLVSPLRAESFKGLPPALIITAGCDPLRAEGAAFAAALQADGVAATHRNYDGLFHGFFGLPHPLAETAMIEATQTLQQAFASVKTHRERAHNASASRR